MILLDLFCGEGGAAVGYHKAGFDIIGVDIKPQPKYPFKFIQANALYPPIDFSKIDAIHASPPCQHFTRYKRSTKDIESRYENLLEPTRSLLRSIGKPFIIENVEDAPLIEPIMLCGSMFNLDVRRHRLFETNWLLMGQRCNHKVWTERKYPPANNRTNKRYTCEIGAWRIPVEVQKAAMGIDKDHKVTQRGISEAIPPAYTEYIGQQLMEIL